MPIRVLSEVAQNESHGLQLSHPGYLLRQANRTSAWWMLNDSDAGIFERSLDAGGRTREHLFSGW